MTEAGAGGSEAGLEAHLGRHGPTWVLAICVTAFLLTYLAPVDASLSDPSLTLLTAQAIGEHGTIRLDDYVADARWDYGPLLPAANGHFYDYFPLGTSLLAAPAVWLAGLRGQDMIHPRDARALQNVLSSLTVVAAALLTWALCRRFLTRSASLAVTAAFVFGSTIASTLGTALWSSNLALVLGLCSLWLLVAASDRRREEPPDRRRVAAPDRRLEAAPGHRRIGWRIELGLGVLVFFAYLCRPTMVLLLPPLAVYLGGRRRIATVFLGTAAGLFALFTLFSWREYGLLLPPYYQLSRLGTGGRFGQALVGHLLSPSRGVLIGSPFLLLTLAGLAAWPGQLYRHRLVRLALFWIGLHWVAISSFHHWWGGWGFGARLFTEALPAFLLLTVLVVRLARDRLPAWGRHAAGAAFFACAIFATFVHSHQGLYNVYAILWNDGVDRGGSRVFDWPHPQFLATPSSVGAHGREHMLLASQPVSPGEAILPASRKVIFEGFSPPEGGDAWRWSKSRRARVYFKTGTLTARDAGMVLEIEAGTYQPQVVEVRLNGVGVGTFTSERNWDPSVYTFPLPAEVFDKARRPLSGARLFELELEIPGAVLVDEGPYQRWLGVCLRRVTLLADQ